MYERTILLVLVLAIINRTDSVQVGGSILKCLNGRAPDYLADDCRWSQIQLFPVNSAAYLILIINQIFM